MTPLYPLRFDPLFRRYIWGGRRLGQVLQKAIGPELDYAESWEIVDRGPDQSVVQFGPLEGTSLQTLVTERSVELLGSWAGVPRFPLLFKFLDAQKILSIQVHPNDDQAARQTPPDLGKTEAWVILDAQPGSYLYAGLKAGITPDQLKQSIKDGTCEDCVARFEPKTGDCFFLTAGAVHALGPGLLVAEIQQSSDTTFRLFDFNRVDASGKPRPLHLEEAFAVIDYQKGPVSPQQPRPQAGGGEELVACQYFKLARQRLSAPAALGQKGVCHLLVVIEGEVSLVGDPAQRPLKMGEVALLPASLEPVQVTPTSAATVLLIDLPERK